MGQPLGLNEDPSNFSVACRQTGPIKVDISKLPNNEEVRKGETAERCGTKTDEDGSGLGLAIAGGIAR